MSKNLKGSLLAILGASLWGLMGVPVRALTEAGLSGYDISFIRCLLAGCAFLVLRIFTKPEILKVSIKGLLISFMYGAIAYSVSFVSYNEAVSRVPVAVATVLMFMSPIWVSILGVLVFKEKVTKKQLISIVVCFIGAVLVSNILMVGEVKLDFIGLICGVINGFGVALQIMIPRYFSKDYDKETLLVYGFLGAALALVPFTEFHNIPLAFQNGRIGSVIIDMFVIGVLCTMVANVSFVLSSNYISTTTSGILSALEVVVSAIVGLIVFSEKLTVMQIVGAVVVIVGALLPSLIKKKEVI